MSKRIAHLCKLQVTDLVFNTDPENLPFTKSPDSRLEIDKKESSAGDRWLVKLMITSHINNKDMFRKYVGHHLQVVSTLSDGTEITIGDENNPCIITEFHTLPGKSINVIFSFSSIEPIS